MPSSDRSGSIAADTVASAVVGVVVTVLAYGTGARVALVLAAPGGILDLVVNTPYHPAPALAAATNAAVYAAVGAVVSVAARRVRGRGGPSRVT